MMDRLGRSSSSSGTRSDLPEQPNGTDNGVHASAGPLEALKERLLWCGFDLEKDPTGSRLVQLAVWDESRHPAINELLENPDVDVAGFKGKAFDLLENKDTPDLYVLANNVAFKEEPARGLPSEGPKGLRTCPPGRTSSAASRAARALVRPRAVAYCRGHGDVTVD